MRLNRQAGKRLAESIHHPRCQRLFIGRAMLARIGQVASGKTKQRIAIPRLTENGDAAGLEYAPQLASGNGQIEMVQNRTAPDGIERPTRKRQTFAVSDEKRGANPVRLGPLRRFTDIAGREIESSDISPAPGQHRRRHAMPATEIENVLAANVTQFFKRRPDPRFMVEVIVVIKQ